MKNTEVMPVWVYILLLVALSTAIVPIIFQAGLLAQPLLNPVMVAVMESLSWLLSQLMFYQNWADLRGRVPLVPGFCLFIALWLDLSLPNC